jgi:hypothetical protein
MKGVPYKKLVGSLMYVTMAIRSYLSYVVNIINQFTQDPPLKHWVAANKVLKYLNHIQGLWLQYSKMPNHKVILIGFSFSNWGVDIKTKRSNTSYTFLLANGAMS